MSLIWMFFMLVVLVCWNGWLQSAKPFDRTMKRLNQSALVVTVIGVVSLAVCVAIQIAMKEGA